MERGLACPCRSSCLWFCSVLWCNRLSFSLKLRWIGCYCLRLLCSDGYFLSSGIYRRGTHLIDDEEKNSDNANNTKKYLFHIFLNKRGCKKSTTL